MKLPASNNAKGHSTNGVHTRFWLSALAACAMGAALQTAHAQQPPAASTQAGFYPYGGAEELTLVTIASAKQSLFLSAEKITSGTILQALQEARKRGVNVLAVLDKSNAQGRNSGASLLTKENIQVHIDHKHSVRSNYIIADGETLLLGRFHYTVDGAKKNADNVLVVKNNPALVKSYRANWQEHWDHADSYK